MGSEIELNVSSHRCDGRTGPGCGARGRDEITADFVPSCDQPGAFLSDCEDAVLDPCLLLAGPPGNNNERGWGTWGLYGFTNCRIPPLHRAR